MTRSPRGVQQASYDLDAALASLSAEVLREVVQQLLHELDDRMYARVASSLIARAARTGSGRSPAAVSDAQVAEVLAYVEAAEQDGRADPSEFDAYLGRGAVAFLRKDYASAHRLFDALLPSVADGRLDLGQRELVDEVLGTDVAECAAQYVVSAYMVAPAAQRAEAVRAAIGKVRGVGHFREPLRELDRVAMEPLPDLAAFQLQWRMLIESPPADPRTRTGDTEEDRWLREVVQRLEGAEGLAKVARATKRAEDLRAWCACLVEAKDWPAALEAFDEAAALVSGDDFARGEFLDGAARAAQTLERVDLAAHLEKAWRASPSMARLRRWLGSAPSKAMLAERVRESLEVCPAQATRQRALLHVLAYDIAAAAKLLAHAPGLGWSDAEHPGHLLFSLFAQLLGGSFEPARRDLDARLHQGADLDTLEALTGKSDKPRLATPEVEALVARAGVTCLPDGPSRSAVLAAMKQAAERRIVGVTDQKRRGHYAHAAQLVRACVGCDKTDETTRWAAALTAEYKRLPALRDALERAWRT